LFQEKGSPGPQKKNWYVLLLHSKKGTDEFPRLLAYLSCLAFLRCLAYLLELLGLLEALGFLELLYLLELLTLLGFNT